MLANRLTLVAAISIALVSAIGSPARSQEHERVPILAGNAKLCPSWKYVGVVGGKNMVGRAVLWDRLAKKVTKVVESDSFFPHALAFSSDGKHVAFAGAGGVSVWHTSSGGEFRSRYFKTVEGDDFLELFDVNHIQFSPKTGRLWVSESHRLVKDPGGFMDNKVYIWDLKDNRKEVVFHSRKNGHFPFSDIVRMAVSWDEEFLALTFHSNEDRPSLVSVLRVKDKKPYYSLSGRWMAHASSMLRDNLMVVIPNQEKKKTDALELVDIEKKVIRGVIRTDAFRGAYAAPDGKTLVTVHDKGIARIIDVLSLKMTREIQVGREIQDVQIWADGKTFAHFQEDGIHFIR